MGRHAKVYAIYKGDEFIELGTKKELSKKLKVSESTISFLASPFREEMVKNKKNLMIAIRIEND